MSFPQVHLVFMNSARSVFANTCEMKFKEMALMYCSFLLLKSNHNCFDLIYLIGAFRARYLLINTFSSCPACLTIWMLLKQGTDQ